MHIEYRKVNCRNCGNEQSYPIANGNTPPLDEAIAVCLKCGFKSIWFMPVFELSKDELDDIRGKLSLPKTEG